MTTDRAAALQSHFATTPMATAHELDALRGVLREIVLRVLNLIRDRQMPAWEWQRFCDMSAGDDPERAVSWEWFRRRALSQRVVTDLAREVLTVKSEALVTLMDGSERLQTLFLSTCADSSHQVNVLTNTLVGTFVHRALERIGTGGEWSETSFDATFKEVIEYIRTDSDVFLCSSPLQRFAMDQDRLTIQQDLWIERLTWEERRKRLQDASIWGAVAGSFDPTMTAQERYALRFRVQLPRFRSGDALPMMLVKAARTTERAVLALRLHGPGPVRSNGRWIDDVTVRFDASAIGSAPGVTRGFGDTYLLAVEESTESDIREVLLLLDQPSEDKGLAVALRRFEFAYERGSDEDRIVDLWVALEALFTRHNERGGLTKKLARRIPALLGATDGERRALSADIRRLYRVRGDVVHGGHINREGIHADAERSAALVRQAIIARLNGQWTPVALDSHTPSRSN